MSNSVVVLPEASEIIRRLKTVYQASLPFSLLYDAIAENAGQQKNALGLMMMFHLAVDRLPEAYPLSVIMTATNLIPRWIEALVDDVEVREEAVELCQEFVQTCS